MLTIKNSTQLQSNEHSTIMEYVVEPPLPITNDGMFIGYDPGTTRMGIATIWRKIVTIYEVNTARDDDAVKRILKTQALLSQCIYLFDHNSIMVIEGSSFSKNFREAELAEVRASAVLWAIDHGATPSIIQPNSIRKRVLGNGKTKADEVWGEFAPDATSALACAYYGLINSSGVALSVKE